MTQRILTQPYWEYHKPRDPCNNWETCLLELYLSNNKKVHIHGSRGDSNGCDMSHDLVLRRHLIG